MLLPNNMQQWLIQIQMNVSQFLASHMFRWNSLVPGDFRMFHDGFDISREVMGMHQNPCTLVYYGVLYLDRTNLEVIRRYLVFNYLKISIFRVLSLVHMLDDWIFLWKKKPVISHAPSKFLFQIHMMNRPKSHESLCIPSPVISEEFWHGWSVQSQTHSGDSSGASAVSKCWVPSRWGALKHLTCVVKCIGVYNIYIYVFIYLSTYLSVQQDMYIYIYIIINKNNSNNTNNNHKNNHNNNIS